MFAFLSSLFTSSSARSSAVDESLIEAATDRVIAGTDSRLQGLGGIRRQLRAPVTRALAHVVELVEALPEPVEISRRTFGSDPRLHAFFASFDHMQQKLGAAKTVETYLRQASASDHDRLYGLLSLQWTEQNRLGTVMQDGHIQREVQQVVINFLNHNFLGPSYSFEEALLNMKKRAFDFMIEITLERIVAERTRYAELERQRVLLQRKLNTMKSGNWGFEEMLRPEKSGARDFRSLQAEIAAIENELGTMRASHEVLDRNLQIIKDTLTQPRELLAMRAIQLRLDSMNIRADTSAAANVHELELTEVYSCIGPARILLPGWLPVDELPPDRASIGHAMRYL